MGGVVDRHKQGSGADGWLNILRTTGHLDIEEANGCG
jgi:hypothetical protein